MDNYSQHMKHWKNHKKDKYYQQCSGYGGNGKSEQATEEQTKCVSISCFEKIVNEVKTEDFPLYIRVCGDGYVSICDKRNLFGTKIENYEELLQFGKDYIY